VRQGLPVHNKQVCCVIQHPSRDRQGFRPTIRFHKDYSASRHPTYYAKEQGCQANGYARSRTIAKNQVGLESRDELEAVEYGSRSRPNAAHVRLTDFTRARNTVDCCFVCRVQALLTGRVCSGFDVCSFVQDWIQMVRQMEHFGCVSPGAQDYYGAYHCLFSSSGCSKG